MGQADDRRSAGTAVRRRFTELPYAPVTAAVLLGMLAVAQALWLAVAGAPHGGHALNGGAAAEWWASLFLLALVSLATTMPLGFLWARPAWAAVIMSAASIVSLAGFQTLTVAGLIAQLTGAYRLGRRGSPLLSAALSLPFLILALTASSGSAARIPALVLASLGPAAALAGSARRAQRDAIEHCAAREAIAGTLLEHTARGERARISRELHDVVAHHISMIAVQAETARLTTPGMPAAGAQRLSSIGDTARAALTEMRRLLGVLREDTETGVADRQPQPGLRQLNELLDAAREASGTGTRLILHGAPVTLDPGVELAAYRIIQEALTNARRHAPGAAVDVELHYADDRLQLLIRDNGPGPPAAPPAPDAARPGAAGPGGVPPGGGHGLLGMRERAAAVGGVLSTGEAAGGGFLVSATLPGKGEVA
ncbi:MAG: sensor histidine kinase [Streptosporangiaceae bacterium]